MTCVYAPTTTADMRVLWQELEAIGRGEDLDWIVGRDFNAIAHQDEKFGGLPRHNWEMADFQDFIQESSLIDLGYVGYPFTWNNKRHGRDNVKERLDRFFASPSWRIRHPHGVVKHLQPGGLDHCPILLEASDNVRRFKQRFIFDRRWAEYEECGNIVRRAWAAQFQEGISRVDSVLRCVDRRVTSRMNRFLTRPISFNEVKTAVFGMDPGSAPGPDGMGASFFQNFWPMVGPNIVEAVRTYCHSRHLLRSINHTHIVLIPKVQCPMNMGHLRPISLCNSVYKILSRVLVNRLQRFLPKIISESQSAFVGGRLISDNIIVVQEAVHYMKSCRNGSNRSVALKLDMSKAYDRVEWGFLEAIMRKMGFTEVWIRWIMGCISSVSYSLLLDGQVSGYIQPSRGLRQGDPLSPYLFLLCAKGLSEMFRNAEVQRLIHGVIICRDGPHISHLLFADDTVVFCKAKRSELQVVDSILKDYRNASGQLINFQKSSMFFSRNAGPDLRRNLSAFMAIPVRGDLGRYLGSPAKIGKTKTEMFSYIKERVL
ncbi:hypothetical protein RHSIM_Rhsim03G0079300 [Rhododendron simsii]|uniref:Reverse transcriptase domain-containing protein n=1 Tax=Rhododendron simsii TaxID=118357 RepID=A0A834LT65_RHOSS|nr:hypothetical protein RHSIM_Rhsim03G0079300 [Rhododendron simsii]